MPDSPDCPSSANLAMWAQMILANLPELPEAAGVVLVIFTDRSVGVAGTDDPQRGLEAMEEAVERFKKVIKTRASSAS